MKYHIDHDKKNKIFTITAAGEFRYQIFRILVDELLTHPQWQPGSNCLFDYRAAEFLNLTQPRSTNRQPCMPL